MYDPEAIRSRVRMIVAASGLLCHEREKTWAGRGTGTHCVACADAISTSEAKYEVEFGGIILRLHRPCYAIWRAECEALGGGHADQSGVA
jgi:hypothetical protein